MNFDQEYRQLRYYDPQPPAARPLVIQTDVCVYGGTSGGIAAAVQGARMGKRVILAEFGRHLGGMSASGLGATDAQKRHDVGGISREFYRRNGKFYNLPEQWHLEPHVARKVFDDLLQEAGVPVRLLQHLASVQKEGTRIRSITMQDGTVYKADMFIDCTYEGDLMAMAGCSFHVGREANSVYGENYNGIQFGHPYHNFNIPIDPYRIPGVPASGLLPCIQDDQPGQQGEGDRRVQAYNFRMCLTDDPANQRPFPKPPGYDPHRYELLARYIDAGFWKNPEHWTRSTARLNLVAQMPNRKTDLNNRGGFSTDHIGANYAWPDGDYATRQAIFQDHVYYTMGLFWFCAHDPRVPDYVHEDLSHWGLAADEFPATGGWPHWLYIREGRRLIGPYVMTEHHCQGRQFVEDPIGLASYTMDSHNVRRIVLGGMAINEGDVQVRVPRPYGVSYRSITPHASECSNLLVPACLSCSHISYGSIRMEPVFMILGQSAATAAIMALDARCSVQQLPYADLRQQLLKDGQVLEWQEPVKK